jgi:hypothetical protein
MYIAHAVVPNGQRVNIKIGYVFVALGVVNTGVFMDAHIKLLALVYQRFIKRA